MEAPPVKVLGQAFISPHLSLGAATNRTWYAAPISGARSNCSSSLLMMLMIFKEAIHFYRRLDHQGGGIIMLLMAYSYARQVQYAPWTPYLTMQFRSSLLHTLLVL